MGIRTVNNPYGGNTNLVDKMIGNAYDIVKLVARHVDEIKYLVTNMEAIIVVAKNLPDTSSVTIGGRLAERGESIELPLPSQITMATLVSSTILVIDQNGNAYQSGNGNFLFWVRQGKLRITLSSEAPASMANAEFRWHVTYRIR